MRKVQETGRTHASNGKEPGEAKIEIVVTMEGIALKIHKLGIGKHLKPLQLSLGKRKDYICKKMCVWGGGFNFQFLTL